MMDTILNLGLNDAAGRRAEARRPATAASPSTATAASSRCSATSCSRFRRTTFEHEFEAVKKATRREARHRPRRGRRCARSSRATRRSSSRRPASRSRRIRSSSCRGARDAVFRSWMNPRAKEYRRIYDIPDHIGTAVNVQTMVFGNTGDRSAHRRRLHAQPRDRREGVLRRVPDQRAGRGRRRRHPHAAADPRAREGDAEGLQAAARDHDAAREALQGRPGLRVHDPGRAAVHAADAQRQAHRLRGGRDRDRPGGREADHAEGGGAAGRSRVAQPAAGARLRSRRSGRRFRSRPRACRRRRARRAARWCSPPITPSSGRSRASR